MTVVLDASALLAVILQEPGSDAVQAFLGRSVMSTVNLCEVHTRLIDSGISEADSARLVSSFEFEPLAFTTEMAVETARLRKLTRHLGLSMGDRCCIALASILGVPAITADRQWAKLDLGIDIHLIR